LPPWSGEAASVTPELRRRSIAGGPSYVSIIHRARSRSRFACSAPEAPHPGLAGELKTRA
jgi:hypothetical protein